MELFCFLLNLFVTHFKWSEGLDFIIFRSKWPGSECVVRVLRTSVTSIREKLGDGEKFCTSPR